MFFQPLHEFIVYDIYAEFIFVRLYTCLVNFMELILIECRYIIK
jgi:hypothetical protein